MRKSYFICLLSLIAVLVAGCNKDNQNTPESLNGDQTRPTWTDPTVYDYTSSMTAVIRVDIKEQYPVQAADYVLDETDLLAAFVGERCVGVATPIEGLFYLTVVDAEGDVTLRYYSAYYKNLFEAANVFVFKNDDHLGTVVDPVVPLFVVRK